MHINYWRYHMKGRIITDIGQISVDTDIIAGLIFNINDTVVDNSVKHKLDKLSNTIMR